MLSSGLFRLSKFLWLEKIREPTIMEAAKVLRGVCLVNSNAYFLLLAYALCLIAVALVIKQCDG